LTRKVPFPKRRARWWTIQETKTDEKLRNRKKKEAENESKKWVMSFSAADWVVMVSLL